MQVLKLPYQPENDAYWVFQLQFLLVRGTVSTEVP